MPDNEQQQIYTLPNDGNGWATGDVITADKMNAIGNVLHNTSAEIANAVNENIDSNGPNNDILARKLDGMIKYFVTDQAISDDDPQLQYNRMYVQEMPENQEEIIVPKQSEYLQFKKNFVSPFSKETNYKIGEYIEYEDKVYKVLVAINANTNAADDAAAWNAITNGSIRKINVMQELDNLINVYSDTIPNPNQQNRIWIQKNSTEVKVPTYDQFSSLTSAFDTIKDTIPLNPSAIFQNKAINEQGITDSNIRLLSDEFTATLGQSFTTISNHEFRLIYLNNHVYTGASNWIKTITITSNMILSYDGFRINARNASDPSAAVSPADLDYATDILGLMAYHNVAPIETKLTVDTIKTILPVSYADNFENKTINAQGIISDDNTRLLSVIIKSKVDDRIIIDEGYEFRLILYTSPDTFSSANTWTNSATLTDYTFTNYPYYRIHVRKISGDDIDPAEMTSNVLTADGLASEFTDVADRNTVKALGKSIDELKNQYNLNDHMTGLQDMCWEYQNWNFPQVLSYTGIRDQLYFTFTSGSGYSGIAQYNYDTGEVKKTILKRNDEVDDHNLISVLMLPDHKLLCAYSDGHNKNRFMYIRKGKLAESIDWFEDVVTLESEGLTTYAQLFYYNENVYLFYRVGNQKWCYRISSDNGVTWSDESVLLAPTNMQYYIQLTETTTSGVLRLCCYSNPSEESTDIRTALLHLDSMTLYAADDTTIISAAPFAYTSVPVVIAQPGNGIVNRLYNALKTNKSDVKILFARFPIDGSATATYYIYDNGMITSIADAGLGYWPPKAQNGLAWAGSNKIVVARGYQSNDVIEIYNYANGNVTLDKQVVANPRGTLGIRTIKPMIDNNARSIVYVKGYFNPTTFMDFNMDGVIYNITD